MKTAALLAAALAGTLAAPPALAQTTLALSSWLPPRHPIVENAIRPWAEDVERVTEGRVRVRILGKPMGAPPAHFDLARDGVADITYGLHSFTRDDRFQRSRIGQFSFIGDDAAAASRAFWRVYTEDLDAEAEHKGVQLLGLFVHGPGVLWNDVRPIETPEDLEGLKIRTPGGYIADLMGDLGATTLFMSSGEVYERLSRGVIDGVTFTYEALTAFNLTEDLSYGMTAPGGLYNTTWFLVANGDVWRTLEQKDRDAIMSISGPEFAEGVGEAWNAADEAAMDAIRAAGVEIAPASEEMLAAIREAAANHEEAWAADLAEQGFDGAEALETMRSFASSLE